MKVQYLQFFTLLAQPSSYTKAMALNENSVPGMGLDSQKIQQYVSVSRTSGIYGTDFGHIGVKFSGHNEIWVLKENSILSRNYDVMLT